MGWGDRIDLHRRCPNPKCRGRVPVDQPQCPECGANYVAARIEADDAETRKARSGRAGGKRVSVRATGRNTLLSGVVLLITGVVLVVLREEGESVNPIFVLLVSGVAALFGGFRSGCPPRLARGQAARLSFIAGCLSLR